MPMRVGGGAPTLIFRRQSYESSGLVRTVIDERLGLTPDEFRVEGDIIAIGPIHDASAFTALINSHVSEIHELGADAQAVAGWNGPGPFKIVNNYLEASTENILFGGSDPSIDNLVPSDIEVRGNHCYKPTRWKIPPAAWLTQAP